MNDRCELLVKYCLAAVKVKQTSYLLADFAQHPYFN